MSFNDPASADPMRHAFCLEPISVQGWYEDAALGSNEIFSTQADLLRAAAALWVPDTVAAPAAVLRRWHGGYTPCIHLAAIVPLRFTPARTTHTGGRMFKRAPGQVLCSKYARMPAMRPAPRAEPTCDGCVTAADRYGIPWPGAPAPAGQLVPCPCGCGAWRDP